MLPVLAANKLFSAFVNGLGFGLGLLLASIPLLVVYLVVSKRTKEPEKKAFVSQR